MQSAVGASKTITGVTKANPAVVSSTAHGLGNGDIVVLSVIGMYQINFKPVRVANITANTFELEGVDSTLFDTFTSGSAAAVTLGTTFSTMGDFTVSGGDLEMIDTTTIHDATKQSQPGSASAIECSGNFNWDPSDAGQVAMKAASEAKVQRVFKVQFSDGSKWYFNGYPGFAGSPAGSAGGKVTSPFKIGGYGRPSFYAA
jgi:hypothetical protein